MKVTALVDFTQSVEVDISLDDVMTEISSLKAPERPQQVLTLLSVCVGALMKVPDALVAEMNAQQREVVGNALRLQVERYTPSKDTASLEAVG